MEARLVLTGRSRYRRCSRHLPHSGELVLAAAPRHSQRVFHDGQANQQQAGDSGQVGSTLQQIGKLQHNEEWFKINTSSSEV